MFDKVDNNTNNRMKQGIAPRKLLSTFNPDGLQDSQEIGQEILRFCLPRYIEENIIGQHYRRYQIATSAPTGVGDLCKLLKLKVSRLDEVMYGCKSKAS